MHLITSLPLFLIRTFKFKTKFILRISGYPKLNFLGKSYGRNQMKNYSRLLALHRNSFKIKKRENF